MARRAEAGFHPEACAVAGVEEEEKERFLEEKNSNEKIPHF